MIRILLFPILALATFLLVAAPALASNTGPGNQALWSRWALAAIIILLVLGGITAALFIFNQRLKREIREREKAQWALRINEERQRLVLEASSEGIWDHNLATGEQYYSPTWKEILGYASEELTPDHAWFLTMIHPDDRQRVISHIEEITAGKRDQYRSEFRMRHKDGSWIWVLSLGKAVERDATGNLVRVLGTHRDITTRKGMEEVINTSERKYRSLYENMRDGFVTIDMDGVIQEFNASFREMLGYDSQKIRALHYNDITPAKWHEAEKIILAEQVLPRGYSEPYEKEYIHKNGTVFPVELRAHLIQDEEGIPTGMWAFVRDISERKRFEAELNKLSQAVEQSPASVVITDRNGVIEYVNPRFTEVTGYSREEAMGQNPRILKSGDLPEPYYKEMWETILSGKVWKGDLINKSKDGQEFWESSSISPILNPDGEIKHIVAVKEDITERKRAEEELVRAKRLAEAANQAKSDFLAAMSHEIRTPMNAVLGMTELTLKTELTTEQRDWLETVRESGEHLLGIIDNILDFSKVEAKKMVLDKVDFNLHESIRSVARAMQVQARRKNLFLKIEIAEDTPHYVVGDPGRLRQILVNLVGNAVKFTDHGGVTIAAAPVDPATLPTPTTGDLVRISVQDTGIGIPPAKQRAIFDHFSQVDGSTTRRYGGHGTWAGYQQTACRVHGRQDQVAQHSGRGKCIFFYPNLGTGRFGTDQSQDRAGSQGRVPFRIMPQGAFG